MFLYVYTYKPSKLPSGLGRCPFLGGGSVVVDLLFIKLPLWESVIVLCFVVRYFMSICAIILMGNRELVALLNLSSWFLVTVVWLFLAVPWCCLQFVIVVFLDHTLLLFLSHFIIFKCDVCTIIELV